ncbi:hypothetical protein C5Y93_29165 [Blastopirellula marina]|uniref:Uncharacterized protein n=1 Tax=Blastopirellula marina TaxID=124 RepID=A0A2S8GD66_9BACT|nr:hypothetical protein C5Y93_29165 [Blastopirellula marina]
MFAKIQGEIRGADGWMLDPCELTDDGRLPRCPDCAKRLGKYVDEVIQYTCQCGSQFDIWTRNTGMKRLVMARATFSRSGHYLNSHCP